MNTETSKVLLFTIGAIVLLFVGAIGMWAIMKISALPTVAPATVTTTTTTASPQTTAAPASAAASTAQPAAPVAAAPAPQAIAAPPGYVLATVINVQPHYITKLIPYQRCHDVAQTVLEPPAPPSGAGAIIGGVAGGLAGSAMGGGHGKIATTIGGTVLGAMAGNAIEGNMAQPQPVTVFSPMCRTHYASHSVQSGYLVTYTYNGQQNTIVMKTAPTSNTIPLALAPAAN